MLVGSRYWKNVCFTLALGICIWALLKTGFFSKYVFTWWMMCLVEKKTKNSVFSLSQINDFCDSFLNILNFVHTNYLKRKREISIWRLELSLIMMWVVSSTKYILYWHFPEWFKFLRPSTVTFALSSGYWSPLTFDGWTDAQDHRR